MTSRRKYGAARTAKGLIKVKNMLEIVDMDTIQGTKELLIEYVGLISPNAQLIEESIKNNKKLVVSGVLQRSDSGNQNGRIYPHSILEREADKYQGMIQVLYWFWIKGHILLFIWLVVHVL